MADRKKGRLPSLLDEILGPRAPKRSARDINDLPSSVPRRNEKHPAWRADGFYYYQKKGSKDGVSPIHKAQFDRDVGLGLTDEQLLEYWSQRSVDEGTPRAVATKSAHPLTKTEMKEQGLEPLKPSMTPDKGQKTRTGLTDFQRSNKHIIGSHRAIIPGS